MSLQSSFSTAIDFLEDSHEEQEVVCYNYS